VKSVRSYIVNLAGQPVAALASQAVAGEKPAQVKANARNASKLSTNAHPASITVITKAHQ
jgi:hypothetical protein